MVPPGRQREIWIDGDVENLDEFVDRVRNGGNLSDADREFLADLADRCKLPTPKEHRKLRDRLIAQHVAIKQAFGEKHESALVDAMKKFGLGRSRTSEILARELPALESMKVSLKEAMTANRVRKTPKLSESGK
jgi:hypothetical protein